MTNRCSLEIIFCVDFYQNFADMNGIQMNKKIDFCRSFKNFAANKLHSLFIHGHQ
jgi:hypothetical protein